jgi:hypothetical protein
VWIVDKAERKRILELARRMGKGEKVVASECELAMARELLACNREIWSILKGGKCPK